MYQQRPLPPLSGSRGASASPSTKKSAKEGSDDYTLCQEYNSYITQLRGLLEETTGQPPTGVHTADVEHRIALIQSALNEVERRHAEARWRIEARQNQRFMDTYARRLAAEAEAEEKRSYAEKQRRAQVEEMRNVQVAYFRDRNGRTDAKAVQCRSHNEKAQEEAVVRAGSNEERRTRNLANLLAERQRKQRELHDREEAKQNYARQVRERRAAQTAREQEEKARQALIHRQEMEGKLALIRESKRSTWSAKKEASRAKSQIVWENGEAILETVQKDHNRLVEELEQRHKQQAQRYAEVRADHESYLQQRAQFRATRQERQQESLRKLVDQRVSRGDAIVKQAESKKEKAERAKERQATQYIEAGKQLDEDIVRHQQRAQEQRDQQYDESLKQHYRRWNHRAARIMEELQSALQAEEHDAAKQSTSPQQRWAAADNRDPLSADQEDAARAGLGIHALPSPQDFAV